MVASTNSDNTFGAELYELRRRCGLSQRKLAEAVGLSKSYISELENQRRLPPPAATVATIAAALNVDELQRRTLLGLAAQDRGGIAVRVSKSAPSEVTALIRQIAKIALRISPARLASIRHQLEADM